MKLRIAIVALLMTPAVTGMSATSAPVQNIEHVLRRTSSVSFYFVYRTEDYDYDAKQIKADASIFVTRLCGGNCAYFMRPVLAYLRASKPTKCMPGQQNVLITFGTEHIIYSYSGRLANYRGQCYYSDKSIGEVLEHDAFFFN